jgi:hypothetical protein
MPHPTEADAVSVAALDVRVKGLVAEIADIQAARELEKQDARDREKAERRHMTPLQMLLENELKARQNLERLTEKREQRVAALRGRMPSEDMAKNIAGMDAQISILTEQLGKAQAALKKEQDRLAGPDAIKAGKDAAKLRADVIAARDRVPETLAGTEKVLSEIRSNIARLGEAQKIAGVERDLQPVNRWLEDMRQALQHVKDLGRAAPLPGK